MPKFALVDPNRPSLVFAVQEAAILRADQRALLELLWDSYVAGTEFNTLIIDKDEVKAWVWTTARSMMETSTASIEDARVHLPAVIQLLDILRVLDAREETHIIMRSEP